MPLKKLLSRASRKFVLSFEKGKKRFKTIFLPDIRRATHHPRILSPWSGSSRGGEIRFVTQERSSGLGDALLQARDFVGTGSFVMIVPDQLFHHSVPATLQLLQRWMPGKDVWCGVILVRKEETDYFIGARGLKGKRIQDSDEFVIKQLYTEAETRELYRHQAYEIRRFGRTIYPSEIFEFLGPDYRNPSTGEVDLLKTFEASARSMVHHGIMLAGEPFDMGTLPGYYHYLPRLWELTA